MSVSVIIPALNEAAHIGATVDAAFAAGAAEVIVCDGGSTDDTLHMVRERGAKVIEAERRRAREWLEHRSEFFEKIEKKN